MTDETKLSYYERNKEKVKAYYQKYYQLNKLKILEKRKNNIQRKEWFKDNYKTSKHKIQTNEFKKIVDTIVVKFTFT